MMYDLVRRIKMLEYALKAERSAPPLSPLSLSLSLPPPPPSFPLPLFKCVSCLYLNIR